MSFAFIEANQALYPISTMCELLKVSRSGFYAWRQRPMSARAQQDQSLQTLIISIHQRSQGTYGAPRIMRELRLAHNIRVSEKRVARLMKQQGLVGEMRRKFVNSSKGPIPSWISAHSGHYFKGKRNEAINALSIGVNAFKEYGITFNRIRPID